MPGDSHYPSNLALRNYVLALLKSPLRSNSLTEGEIFTFKCPLVVLKPASSNEEAMFPGGYINTQSCILTQNISLLPCWIFVHY